ncbi:PHD finger protein ALFIN-LIKE 8 [Platanthera guangdongensis]|uniref:PHD finger protein ALFIN-LIKE n=1 Tax=Platanthera guangdongensis TaxID=2320717 RepID=A0ABR2MTR8_9ASPA
MINKLPTIYEVVTGTVKKQSRAKTPILCSKISKPSSKLQTNASKAPPRHKDLDESGEDEEEEDGDEHGNTLCGACGDNYVGDEFWICCDFCQRWFHGKCVKITPAGAEHIKQYKFPSCSNKRARE